MLMFILFIEVNSFDTLKRKCRSIIQVQLLVQVSMFCYINYIRNKNNNYFEKGKIVTNSYTNKLYKLDNSYNISSLLINISYIYNKYVLKNKHSIDQYMFRLLKHIICKKNNKKLPSFSPKIVLTQKCWSSVSIYPCHYRQVMSNIKSPSK